MPLNDSLTITLHRTDITLLVEHLRLLDLCSLLPAHLQPLITAIDAWAHTDQSVLSVSASSPIFDAPQDISDPFVRLPNSRAHSAPAPLIDGSDHIVRDKSRSTGPSVAFPTTGKGSTLRTRSPDDGLPLEAAQGAGEPLPPTYPNGVGGCNQGPLPPDQPTFREDFHISSSPEVDSVLAELATAHWNSSVHDVKGWVAAIAELFKQDQTSFHDQTLSFLVSRCTRLTATNVNINFLWMTNLIQIVATCQNLRLREGTTSLARIWRQELKSHPYRPQLRTFTTWNAMGSKLAMLVGGGSVYLLILIAGLRLRTSINKMPAHALWQLTNILRAPVKPAHRQLVEKFIVPTIAQMISILPLSLDTVFSSALLEDCQLPRDILCHDLQASDGFFDTIILNSFNLSSRDMSIWCNTGELVASSDPSPPPRFLYPVGA